jgi:hypothetical protein
MGDNTARRAAVIDRYVPAAVAILVNLLALGIAASVVVSVIALVGFGIDLSPWAQYGIPAGTAGLAALTVVGVVLLSWEAGLGHERTVRVASEPDG